jgi:hypothetical protein
MRWVDSIVAACKLLVIKALCTELYKAVERLKPFKKMEGNQLCEISKS